VLYVAYRPPYPPDKGERIRMFHQIRGLADRMAVHLVYPAPEPNEAPPAALLDVCASVQVVREPRIPLLSEAASFIRGQPRALGRYHSRDLLRAVQEVIASQAIDVILASTVHMGPVARAVRGIPRVVDLMDVYSEVWLATARWRRPPRAWLDRWEGVRLAAYEARLARSVETMVFATDEEAALFRRGNHEGRVAVVPNGVDLEYFRPRPDARDGPPGLLAFVGTMDYPPNHDAAQHLIEDIVPRIRSAHRPHVLVVGRHPPTALLELAARSAVAVTGEVPDVRPHLARASVAVAPFRMGRGVQNKVLEAMAMGIPVVASPLGAEGIGAGPEDGLIVEATADDFASRLQGLLSNPDATAALGARARAFVEAHHRWDVSSERLADVLDAAVRVAAS
jgi:sugar transferase (PEP-CTERM/EpsH1 system associated)